MTYNRRDKKREWAKEYLKNVSLAVYSIPNPKLGNIGGYRSLNWRQWFILQATFFGIVSSWYRLYSIHASIGSLCANDELSLPNYKKELIGAPLEQKRIRGEGKFPMVWQQTKTPFAMTNSVSHNCRVKAPCYTNSKQQNSNDKSRHYWQGNSRHNWEAPYHWSTSSFMNAKSKLDLTWKYGLTRNQPTKIFALWLKQKGYRSRISSPSYRWGPTRANTSAEQTFQILGIPEMPW